MHIAVVCDENIAYLPPVLSLISGLGRLGQEVTLLTRDASCLGADQLGEHLHVVEYGTWGISNYLRGVKNLLESQKFVRAYLHEHRDRFDVVWAASDMSARMAGRELEAYRYVIQLHELVEHVPAFTRRKMPIESKSLIRLARGAWKVVVPEYNRAFIQAAYWDLPHVPFVLPNKPAYAEASQDEFPDEYAEALERLRQEPRKVMLYQGAFGNDRDLVPYARAIQELGDEYALYLLGPCVNEENKANIDRACEFDNVTYLGYVRPPHHLHFTRLAHVGLMPYAPSTVGYFSKLNALYCAPNKIWEYARSGVPMLATDVPGIHHMFQSASLGVTIGDTDVATICEAVRRIDKDHRRMTEQAKKYYSSVDYDQLLAKVLEL